LKSKGKITESGKVTGILTVLRVPEKDNLAVFGEREREKEERQNRLCVMDFFPELESH